MVLTQAELNRKLTRVTEDAFALFLAAAMDEFHWSNEQIQSFIDRLHNYADGYKDHYISIDEVRKALSEQHNLKV